MATATDFNLSNFSSQLKGGALANQFYADLSLPAGVRALIPSAEIADQKFRFSFKTTALPPSTLGEIIVPFRGAQFKIFGDRVFTDWNITVLNDQDFSVHNAFETWSDTMVGHVQHDSALGDQNPLDYMGTGEVHQLTRNSEVLKSYSLIGAWPKEVGEVAVSWDSTNQIEEFQVTMSYQWFETSTTRNNSTEQPVSLGGGDARI